MFYAKCFGIQIFVFLFVITKVCGGDYPCYWKKNVNCGVLCNDVNISRVTHSIEEKWAERPQCHADGISLEMSEVTTNSTGGILMANWFQPNIKVKYLEFGVMDGFSVFDENVFNADAFRSVKQLVFTKMERKTLKNGVFRGLESLEVLKIKGAYELMNIDMGILDHLNGTLKEFSIERNGSYIWNGHVQLYENSEPRSPLRIDVFTGSGQNSNLEFVKIRYYLERLRNQSFVSLKKVKILDLSNCGILSIDEGTFDPVIGTIKVIRLTNNYFKTLPNGLLDLMTKPLNYGRYIFFGRDIDKYECLNFPVNYVGKVSSSISGGIFEAPYQPEERCNLLVSESILSKTTSTPSIPSTPSRPLNNYYEDYDYY